MSELSDALRAQRVQIAGEVHDEIIPPLFAARMRLETLAARLERQSSGAGNAPATLGGSDRSIATEIHQAVALIQQATSRSRQLLADLAPHDPGQSHWNAQIEYALGNHPAQLQQRGQIPWTRLDPETAITLTLIAGEAIRNAVRHGKPDRIEITVAPRESEAMVDSATDGHSAPAAETNPTMEAETYQLTISDDGAGFDPRSTSDHHGLHLMQLRATAIGGQLEIASQPGGPTRVTLRWPVPPGDAG